MTARLFRQCLLALCVAAAALVLLGRHTSVDLWLADRMYDFTAGGFPWRDDWFAAVLMHQWMKSFFIGLGLVPFAILMVDARRSRKLLDAERRAGLAAVGLCFLLVSLAASLLKSGSMHGGICNAMAARFLT